MFDLKGKEVVSVELVTFVVSITLPTPSSPAVNSKVLLLITPLFS